MIEAPSHGNGKIAGNGYSGISPNSIYPSEKQKTEPSYSSIDEGVNEFKIPLALDYRIAKKSQSAQKIVRTFYTKKINESLEWLSKNHETSIDSTPYIQPLLANLKKEQFALLIEIMLPLNNNPKLDYDKIDKAINKLEKLGLDSTPF